MSGTGILDACELKQLGQIMHGKPVRQPDEQSDSQVLQAGSQESVGQQFDVDMQPDANMLPRAAMVSCA